MWTISHVVWARWNEKEIRKWICSRGATAQFPVTLLCHLTASELPWLPGWGIKPWAALWSHGNWGWDDFSHREDSAHSLCKTHSLVALSQHWWLVCFSRAHRLWELAWVEVLPGPCLTDPADAFLAPSEAEQNSFKWNTPFPLSTESENHQAWKRSFMIIKSSCWSSTAAVTPKSHHKPQGQMSLNTSRVFWCLSIYRQVCLWISHPPEVPIHFSSSRSSTRKQILLCLWANTLQQQVDSTLTLFSIR